MIFLRLLLLSLLVSGVSLSMPVLAANGTTQTGRYLTVANQPLAAQDHLLEQTFQVRFPAQVKTIGDAMRYLLQFSGF